MTSPPRPSSSYVHGLDGPAVVVPGRVAALLVRKGLGNVRNAVRGLDPEVDAVLEAVLMAAEAWRLHRGIGSDHGTELAKQGADGSESPLTTAAAAALLEMSDRGVRKAISDGRLAATRVGDVWVIDREAVELFRAARPYGGAQ